METIKMKQKSHNKALNVSKKHEKLMKGKKTILIPHPTVPHTFIEKIINDEKE